LVNEVGFITTDDGLFGASVDGLVGQDGVIEIKTMVSSNTLFDKVVYGDISDYIDQCNGAMWLLSRQWCDLILWCPDLNYMKIHRIERNDDIITELESDLIAFMRRVNVLTNDLRKALA